MLIRTQDKLKLIEVTNITICINKYMRYPVNDNDYKTYFHYKIESPAGVLGIYSTEEKAKEVLDMIEKKYLEPTYINDLGGNEYAKYESKIFYMPEDEK